jgi:alpha-galactosidase
VFARVQLATTVSAAPPPIRLPGLAPDLRYRVEVLPPSGRARTFSPEQPPWFAAGSAVLAGSALAAVGLSSPMLGPPQLILLHATAV